jgi:RNA polymerase sigma factor (sigma-70 family)
MTAASLAEMSAEPTPQTDDGAAELSAGLVAGQEVAWAEFHAQTFDRLLRYLLAASYGHEDAAREALQATYVKCVRHVRRFATKEAMWAWLAQIARGCLIDLARQRQRYAALLERFAAEAEGIGRETSPASAAREEWLSASLARLEPEERSLLEAHYTDEKPIAEIAATMGASSKAIESRLARIRHRLRAWLTRPHHET